MADIFDSPLSNFAPLLDTETDYDTPFTQIQADKLRLFLEALTTLGYSTGATGTLTSDPSNSTDGHAIDTAAGFTDDEHNGRTLVFTDGNAIGNMYTIDDTSAAANRVTCSGDNMYADGARSGDAYEIFYDLMNNTDGHDHDGVNSASVVLADGVIVNAKIGVGQIRIDRLASYVVQNVVASSASNEQSVTDSSYGDYYEARLYFPTDCDSVQFFYRVKVSGNTGYIKFRISGTDELEETFDNTSYAWVNSDVLDVSSYGGGVQTVRIYLKNSNAVSTTYNQGLTLAWRAAV